MLLQLGLQWTLRIETIPSNSLSFYRIIGQTSCKIRRRFLTFLVLM